VAAFSATAPAGAGVVGALSINPAAASPRAPRQAIAKGAAHATTHALRYDSLDEVYSDHSEWFADDAPDAFENLASGDLRRAITAAIGQLPEREALVLQLYFVEELNLEEIGQTLNVGAARVCQIKKAALDKVRGKLSAWTE